MENAIKFVLNGRVLKVNAAPGTRLIDVIRSKGFTGTKEGCGDGDCGACTVLMGESDGDKVMYRAVSSCLIPIEKAARKAIVTVEGLKSEGGALNIIQRALVDNYGIQCGFCTPGIVMALSGSLVNGERPSYKTLLTAMDGNICRCTGYEGIRNAAMAIAEFVKTMPSSFDILPPFVRKGGEEILKEGNWLSSESYVMPETEEELISVLHNHSVFPIIVSGNTDIGVKNHMMLLSTKDFAVDISSIRTFRQIKKMDDYYEIGTSVPVSEILKSKIVDDIPVAENVFENMASSTIRNVATLGGNIVNASPIADGVVFLSALDAKLILLNKTGKTRIVPIRSFYKGYKKTVLEKNELISKILLPIPSGAGNFIKSAKRMKVDIASVSSLAILEKDGNVTFSFGGVAPTVKTFKMPVSDVDKMTETIMTDISPITDIRGSAWYRNALVKGHVIEHMDFFKEGGYL